MRRAVLVLVTLLWTPIVSAQFVGPGGAVPIVANNPGLAGTLWRSDVSVTNVSGQPTSVVLLLYPELVDGEPAFDFQMTSPRPLAGTGQLTLANVLESEFGLRDVKGALSVVSTDGAPVLVSSRVYNEPAGGGTFGQDAQAMLVGDTAWAGGLAHDSFSRTNIGVFLPVDPQSGQQVVFEVTIRAADGSVAGAGVLVFPQAGVIQKSLSAFDVGLLVDGWVEIRCTDPGLAWYAYASRVDQITGDAVFRPFRGLASSLP